MSFRDLVKQMDGPQDLSSFTGSNVLPTGIYKAQLLESVFYEGNFGQVFHYGIEVFPKNGSPVKVTGSLSVYKKDGTKNLLTERIIGQMLMTFGDGAVLDSSIEFVGGITVEGVYGKTVTGFTLADLEVGSKGAVAIVKFQQLGKDGNIYDKNKVVEWFTKKGLHATEVQKGETENKYLLAWREKYTEDYVEEISAAQKQKMEAAAAVQTASRPARQIRQAPPAQPAPSVVDDSDDADADW